MWRQTQLLGLSGHASGLPQSASPVCRGPADGARGRGGGQLPLLSPGTSCRVEQRVARPRPIARGLSTALPACALHKAGAEPADRRLERGNARIWVTQQIGERLASGLTSSLTSGLSDPAVAGVQGLEDVSGLWAKAPRVVNAGLVQPPLLVASLCSGKKVDDSSRLMSTPVERASLASGSQKLHFIGTA